MSTTVTEEVQRRGLADPIVVVYGVDDRFAIPLAASIQSVLEHLGPGHRIDVHIIDGGLSPRNRSRIIRSFEGEACRLVWLRPQQPKLASLKVGGAITVATYYRLLIPDLLPFHPRAIYLDADLIVLGDLADLWAIPLGHNHLLAVQDQGVRFISGPYGLSNYKSLGIRDSAKYFNAGVLVLNLVKWRQEKTADTIVDYITRCPEHIRFHDQDGLNALLWDKWGELDPRWNQMPQILQVRSIEESPFDPQTHLNVTDHPLIIHYASADKPWRFGCRHPATSRFFEYLDHTEYRGYRPSRWRTWFSDRADFVRRRLTKIPLLARLYRTGRNSG